MPELSYHHGTQIVRVPDGTLTFTVFDQAPIGLIGTAPDADNAMFPLDQPLGLTGDPAQIEALGATGTLKDSIDAIIAAAGGSFMPQIGLVRIAQGASPAETLSNALGNSGSYTGWHALKHARSELGFKPKTYLAPTLTGVRPDNAANPLVAAMAPWLERQRSRMLAAGPSGTKEDAVQYRGDIGSMAIDIIDPRVLVFDAASGAMAVRPPEAYVAGLGARIIRDGDAETHKPAGFWSSWSNAEIGVISGTERRVSFDYADPDTEATFLNSNQINTIIRDKGWRYWGGLTASSDPTWQFSSVVRTRYAIEEMAAADFAPIVDAPMDAAIVVDALVSFNDKLDDFVQAGAAIGARAFFLKEENSVGNLRAGKLRIEFDAEETPPIHSLSIGSRKNVNYFDVFLDDVVRNLATPAG